MYLGEFIEQLDTAISQCESAEMAQHRALSAQTCEADKANVKAMLRKLREHAYRLRCMREGLLAERDPGSYLN
jgi:hypothetical protein